MVDGVEDRYKQILLQIILKHLTAALVYLYGSRARGDARDFSDVDLAIDAGKSIEWNVLCKIRSDIEESTVPFFVDIIDLQSVSNEFKKEIQKEMILWTK